MTRATATRILAAATLALAAAFAPAFAQDTANPDAASPAANPDAAVLGDPDAPVTIVEYASTTCPHCANFHATLFPHIKAEWIDTGRAKLAMRPLLTAPVEQSAAGFLLARCAAPDAATDGGEAYFAALGEIFATQSERVLASDGGTLQAYYEGVAGRHGVSPDQLEQCFGDPAGVAQINAAGDAAEADGVNRTPGFVIAGVAYLAEELATPEAWDATLQAALDAQ